MIIGRNNFSLKFFYNSIYSSKICMEIEHFKYDYFEQDNNQFKANEK